MSSYYYFDIIVLPNAKEMLPAIFAKIMEDLHKLLCKFGQTEIVDNVSVFKGRIGLDFPMHKTPKLSLGAIIRPIGKKTDIEMLYENLLYEENFVDYTLVKTIEEVPDKVQNHIKYTRVRKQGNSYINRAEKRLPLKEAWKMRNPGKKPQKTLKKKQHGNNLPFVKLNSLSTGKKFSLIIDMETTEENTEESSKNKIFDSYGLSRDESTIPKF